MQKDAMNENNNVTTYYLSSIGESEHVIADAHSIPN